MPQLLESHEHSGTAPKRVRSGVVTPFVNECFEGEMLFFVRDPSLPVAPKQRYWELQVQGRFRKRVENFYMGMELTEPLKVSFFLRGLAATFTAFVKSVEPDIHYSLGVSKADAEERPHLVTPYFKGVDAIVETVDGSGEPPALGSDLLSGPRIPKSERPTSVRLDATYTFSVFSTFLDFFAWKIKGIPALGSVDLAGYFRDAALAIVVYCVPTPDDARSSKRKSDKAHLQSEKNYFLRLQVDPPHIRPARSLSRQSTPDPRDAEAPSASEPPLLITSIPSTLRRLRSSGGSGKGSSLRRSSRGSKEDSSPPEKSPLSRASSGKAATNGASAAAAATTPQRPPPQPELLAAPPLFRDAIGNTPAEAVDQPLDAETAELAQQRLLVWMSGAGAGGKKGHRRVNSDPSKERDALAAEGRRPSLVKRLTRTLSVTSNRRAESAAVRRAKSSPWLSIVSD